MSEYLSKKAVLEHIRREINIIDRQKDGASRFRKTFSRGAIRGLENLEHIIQSGAFDADESEVQRLRAALEHILEYWNRDENEQAMSDALWTIIEIAEEALSTTTEPTNAAKVKRIECPSCGCEISIKPKTELLKGEETA